MLSTWPIFMHARSTWAWATYKHIQPFVIHVRPSVIILCLTVVTHCRWKLTLTLTVTFSLVTPLLLQPNSWSPSGQPVPIPICFLHLNSEECKGMAPVQRNELICAYQICKYTVSNVMHIHQKWALHIVKLITMVNKSSISSNLAFSWNIGINMFNFIMIKNYNLNKCSWRSSVPQTFGSNYLKMDYTIN